MKKFWIRTLSATVYAALFIFCIYAEKLFDGGYLFLVAFMLFVACGATYEFFKMVRLQGARPQQWVGYLAPFIFIPCACCAILNLYSYAILNGLTVLLGISFILITSVLLIIQLWRESDQPFRDVAYSLLSIMYITLPLTLISVVGYIEPNLMFMILILVWVNDSFAYMGGSLVGKHKMWQRHSPGKTWEGTAIGLVATIAVALVVGPLFHYGVSIQWYDWIVIALICSVIGTLGDLVESMLKRSVGVKDSGNIMPGHGGFLDRFDSLLMIMPFIVIYFVFMALN